MENNQTKQPVETRRRQFLQRAAMTTLAGSFLANNAKSATDRPRLGVVIDAVRKESPDAAVARVHRFNLPTCQVHVGMSPPGLAAPLREALSKYNVEATAVMTLEPGKKIWNFKDGPRTIGIVPRDTRAARIDALKRASDLAKQCNIGAVHTHCGFIPEDPNDPLYEETVTALRDIGSHCKANGQHFLMETGQETPITMLRAIEDSGLDNIAANLDTANLILYGKGEPVGAMDVIGKRVLGLHAKDGLYPTDPSKLGQEVAIGKGRVDFPQVMRQLKDLNYTGPITIEREISGPRQEEDIRQSISYLNGLIQKVYG
jgi:L-ribulose-5-phosphate 3-epimerase